MSSNLSNLKNELDKLDINKLVPVPVEVKRCSKNDVVKKTEFDKLVKKINDIQILVI